MKWIDYREKLGIGFNDTQKTQMFINKVQVQFDALSKKIIFDDQQSLSHTYFCAIGETPPFSYTVLDIAHNICKNGNLSEIVSKLVALINSTNSRYKDMFKSILIKDLDELSIQYELITDEDGIFVFPKGAEELDEGEINAPLEWLSKYPLSRKSFCTALTAYSEGENPSQIADLFRKSLETFYQEFFEKEASLENIKKDFGKFLKDKGVPSEISGNIETVLKLYTTFNNNYAKHHDKTSVNVLEFIMYQTGNLIRLIITLKNERNV